MLRSISRTSFAFRRHFAGLLVAGTVLSLVSGCAGTFDKTQVRMLGSIPAEKPTTLTLGQVQVTDARISGAEAEIISHAITRGVAEWAKKNSGLETIMATTNTLTGGHGIVLTGTITEVEKGSSAMRFLVGMGAGQSRIRGDFEIQDPTGAVLTSFTSRRSYLGGTGAGGADMVSMEDLAYRLGLTVAESTHNWLQGKAIE